MSCTETGTIGGTTVHSQKRNDEWNAERCKPAPMLAFQRNDTWNDTRIPTPERSNPPLEGGTVERAERELAVDQLTKPEIPKTPERGSSAPRNPAAVYDCGEFGDWGVQAPCSVTGIPATATTTVGVTHRRLLHQ